MRDVLSCLLLIASVAAPSTAQEAADLILYNGKVFTADDMRSLHRTVVVRNGHIVAVGGEDLTSRYRARHTVDLKGRLVVPGFNDSHTHMRGHPQRYVNMQGTRSIAEFKERLRRKADELGPGEWITGWGWSEDEFVDQRRPLRGDLDDAVPNNPAIIARAGGHSAVANSLALRLASVTSSTPDPESGIIEKDENGEPNGVFRENWGMIARLIPDPSDHELRRSLVSNLRDLFALGITSFTEAMTSPERVGMWQDIYREHRGTLPRATLQIHIPVGFGDGERAAARLGSLDLRPGAGDEFLRVGALKIFVDGGFTGPAAWTLEHYRDQPDYYGRARLSEHDLYVVLRSAHDLGWQVGLHTIGDAAITTAVDQLAKVLDDAPRAAHRHYLNHFTVRPPVSTLRRMAEHNILVAQQPNFTYTLEGRYVANLLGERLQTNNPLRTLIEHGIFVALGADIMPTDPLLGIYAATTRRGMSGAVYGAGERLSVTEALVGYTRNGAYLTFEETIKGTIEVNQLADLVVLSRDLLSIPLHEILDTQVDMTLLGGKVVYARPSGSGTDPRGTAAPRNRSPNHRGVGDRRSEPASVNKAMSSARN